MYASHTNIPPMLPSGMLGSLAIFDGIDTHHNFSVYGILATSEGVNAIYMFCKLQGSTCVQLYIGRADNLANRLTRHERVNEAVHQGASHLLVHVPGYAARINYIEAERRLIAFYNPPLNILHRIT